MAAISKRMIISFCHRVRCTFVLNLIKIAFFSIDLRIVMIKSG